MKRKNVTAAVLALLAGAAIAGTSDKPIATPEVAKGTTPLDSILANLEPTGTVVIRHLRVPADGNKPARLIRFQVPVYRERTSGITAKADGQTVIDATIIR